VHGFAFVGGKEEGEKRKENGKIVNSSNGFMITLELFCAVCGEFIQRK
jgi:hypothetical protein